MLVLIINKIPNIGSQIALSYLTLSYLEMSTSRSLGFRSLVSRERTYLGPVLLLTINRKPYTHHTATFDLK